MVSVRPSLGSSLPHTTSPSERDLDVEYSKLRICLPDFEDPRYLLIIPTLRDPKDENEQWLVEPICFLVPSVIDLLCCVDIGIIVVNLPA